MKRHFVIATYGSSGDVFPFLEIGKHLLGNHHEVSFITTPWYENIVKRNNMQYVPFGTMNQLIDLLNDPARWDPVKGINAIWAKGIQPNVHAIRAYVRSLDPKEEVVILCNPLMMPAADLARIERKNLKIVLFYFQPASIRTHYGRVTVGAVTFPKCPPFLTRLLYAVIDKIALDVGIVHDLNNERQKLNLAPVDHFFSHLRSSADLYVTLFPEWYAPIRPDYPKPLITGDFVLSAPSEDPLTDELAKFLDAGEPPIVFTAGTLTRHFKKFFEIAVDVVRKLNARAIFLTGFREQLPAHLPPSVLWQIYAPLSRILLKTSVLVHHGGMGTLAEASKAGVPQLIVPYAYDHFENARIITDLGIGTSISLQSATESKLSRKLSKLLHSKDIKERCMKVSSNFRASFKIGDILDKMLSAIEFLPRQVDGVSGLEKFAPEPVVELLNRLATQGLKLSIEGDNLNCYAPRGSLTREIRESILRNKPEIISILRDYDYFKHSNPYIQ
jgi:rhamnosyltransferase subunit B